MIEIDAVRVPTSVEVAGLVLGGAEAAVQPDLPTAGCREKLDRFRETVEQTPTPFGPAEPFDHLVPRREVLTGRQPSTVWIERRKHITTLSLCSSDCRASETGDRDTGSHDARLLSWH